MWLWLLLSCLFGWLPPGQGQFHTQSATWFTADKLRPDAYFGFSITYEPTSKKLIVGAPQGDEIGEVYSCNIDDQQCIRLPSNLKKYDAKHNYSYWLGAVVKAGPSYFVTCAPLNTEPKTLDAIGGRRRDMGTFSHCYVYTNTTQLPDTLRSLSDEDRHKDTSYFEQKMDSLGWSIDVADDHIIIGGPAMFTGRAIIYYDIHKGPVSLTGISTSKNNEIHYNFGYSVVTGNFSTFKKNRLVYAIGSPYGQFGYGSVSFYSSVIRTDMTHQGNLIGSDESTVGSMFGAVLCAVRLTRGSDTTALVVGAPTYAKKNSYNVGAVYIYEAGKLPLKNLLRKIEGHHDGAYFGSAIVSVGDLNGDGMDEIAIGAPYEDSGSGAVYLYSSKDIVNKEQIEISSVQKIIAEPNDRRQAFGLSLTAVQDYDENGCNELAIGAPETNKVMLLRSIASITVRLYESIPDLRKFKGKYNPYINDTHFYFSSCLEIIYPEKPKDITATLKVRVEISHPDAKLVGLNEGYYDELIHDRTTPKCRNITVETQENGNYIFPIQYKIIAINDPLQSDKFDVSRVALSNLSKLSVSGSIRIAECNDTNNCQPKLIYMDTKLFVKDPYVIGSTTTIDVEVAVRNEGEVAYDSCLRISFENAPVKQMPQECGRVSATELKCAPKQIIRNNAIWRTQPITIEVTHLTNSDEHITVNIDTYNRCELKSFEKFQKVIKLVNDNHSGVFIKGVTDTGDDNFVNLTKAEVVLGKAFEHSYTISNNGPTNWMNIMAKVILQKRSFIENYTIILSVDGTSLEQNCHFFDEDDKETVFTCKIERLFKVIDVSKIIVPLFIKPGELETALEKKQNTVYTKLILEFEKSGTMEYGVNSTLNLTYVPVPLWIILSASFLGLIILLIIFLILRECGFFQRNIRKDLDQVRRSVKRQTMMRQSMMNRGAPEGDIQNLIEPESELNEEPREDRRVRVDEAAST